MTITITTDITGQIGITPRLVHAYTTGNLAYITTAGVINSAVKAPSQLYPTDVILMIYNYNVTTKTGTAALFTPIFNAGQITLTPIGPGGNATGNVQAGQSGVAGALISYPGTALRGYLEVAGVANTGNTATILSNVAMGQASTINIADPAAATAYLNPSLVNASLTPVGAFLRTTTTLGFAALASTGKVNLQVASGAMQFHVMDIRVNYTSAGLSGGGGDRLIAVSDGVTVYNNAGITAALAGTPINTVWGGTGNPLPGTVSMNTATAAGASLYAQYAGGTTDYTAGAISVTVLLERIA